VGEGGRGGGHRWARPSLAARSARPGCAEPTAPPVSLRLQPVGAADHLEHDLVGTGADPVQARVAPRALDAVLLHVARASVYLQALVGDFAGDARGVQLGHRDLAYGVLAVCEAPSGRVNELARRFDLGGHVGELVADDLEVADRPAERFALFGVGERAVEAALRTGDGAGRADHA